MLSDKSIQLFSYIVNVGYRTRLLPYTWDFKNSTVILGDRLKQRKIFIISSIAFRLLVISSMCIALVKNCKELSVVDYLYAAFVLAATCFVFVIELHHLVYTRETALFMSSSVQMAQILAKHHKLSTKVSDGADILVTLMCLGLVVVIPCFWVVYILQVQLQFPLFSLLSSNSSVIWNILIGSAWGYAASVDIFVIAFHAVICLYYANSMTKFMTICRYDPHSTRRENKQMLIFHRCHQILHIEAEFFSESTNTGALVFTAVFQTSVLYIIIKGTQTDVRVILGILVVAIIAGTKILVDLAADYTDASMAYPNSMVKSIYESPARMNDAKKIKLWKHLGKIHKTFHPFKFSILKLSYFTRCTFLIITFETVIQYLVLFLTEFK